VALTSVQQAQVRRALGYPDTPLYPVTFLIGTMGALSAEGEALVVGYLADIALIDTLLSTARQKHLAVGSLEGISLRGRDEIQDLLREGTRICAALGQTLGISPMGDPFMGAGGSHGSVVLLP
jgi:hypothetical protein